MKWIMDVFGGLSIQNYYKVYVLYVIYYLLFLAMVIGLFQQSGLRRWCLRRRPDQFLFPRIHFSCPRPGHYSEYSSARHLRNHLSSILLSPSQSRLVRSWSGNGGGSMSLNGEYGLALLVAFMISLALYGCGEQEW